MCGRYVLYDRLTGGGVVLLGREIPPNFNIAPTATAPIIRPRPEGGERELVLARWGLVPPWARDLKIPPYFNARADRLERNRVFGPVRNQRCLVPMTGFYEWSEHDKQPFYVHLEPERLFYAAGLWNRWRPKDEAARPLESFTVITTGPNEVLADIHHRMPAILDEAAAQAWLEEEYDAARALLRPFPGKMAKHPVDPRIVNNARNNRIECIRPVGSVSGQRGKPLS